MRLLCIIAVWTLLLSNSTYAQDVHDDFSGPTISSKNWFVCNRDENEFELVDAGHFRAAKAVVHPRVDIEAFGLLLGHKECHVHDGQDDTYERAELWEADSIVQKFGTETWYQFSMYVDPSVTTSTGRLVIGQWKEGYKGPDNPALPLPQSPILAQRFDGRRFTVTIQQDNESAGHNPEDTDCRVIVASQSGVTSAFALKAMPHILVFPQGSDINAGPKAPLSIGHDRLGVSHGVAVPDSARLQSLPCYTDLQYERFADLPDPFGHWIKMTYHFRPSVTVGLLEIWANDILISRLTGRIGYRQNDPDARQYFKFGPYRDRNHVGPVTFAMIANYARAAQKPDLP